MKDGLHNIRASYHQVNEELIRTSLADAAERYSSTPTKASHTTGQPMYLPAMYT